MKVAAKKSSWFLLIFLVASTLPLIPTATATITQTTPELTVRIVDRSYDVPLTYKTSTNPYTGQQETTKEGGYRVENKTLELTIKNPPYDDRDRLHYNVRVKGHFTQEWTILYGRECWSANVEFQLRNNNFSSLQR